MDAKTPAGRWRKRLGFVRRLAGLTAFGLITALGGFILGLRPTMFAATTPTQSTICVASKTPLTLVTPPSYLAPFATWHEGLDTPADGIARWTDGSFHPGSTAQLGIRALNDASQSRARLSADALLANGERDATGLWFPYRFSYSFDGHPVRAPWVSGFAQGQALSLFSRLSGATGDSRYARAAGDILPTLAPGSRITSGGSTYRIEEIPLDPPNTILNGWVFGLLGLYDYQGVTGDAVARVELVDGLTTVRTELHRYIGANGELWYDLLRHTMGPSYYLVHRDLFASLYGITGESCFAEASRLYAAKL